MSRIDLPDGAWAEIRNPKKVPERLRRPAKVASYEYGQSRRAALEQAASTASPAAPENAGAWGAPPEAEVAAVVEDADVEYDVTLLQATVDTGVVALVASWSFGDVVSLDALLDLPGDAYDVLCEAVMPLIGEMFVDLDESVEPDSPSSPLSA